MSNEKPVELTEAEIESLDVMGMFPTPHGFAHATEWEEGVTRDLIRRVTHIVAAREAAARREALLEAADDLEPLVDNQHSAALNPDAWLRDRAEEITS